MTLEKAKSIKSGVQDKAQWRSWKLSPATAWTTQQTPTITLPQEFRARPEGLQAIFQQNKTCDQFLQNADDCGQPQVLKVISGVLYSEGREHTHTLTGQTLMKIKKYTGRKN